MVVKTQLRGSEVTGLRVGSGMCAGIFPKAIRVIELQLDHLADSMRAVSGILERRSERFTILGFVNGWTSRSLIEREITRDSGWQ